MVNLPDYHQGGALQAPSTQLQSPLTSYVQANLLAANVPEFITVPTDENGKKARFVLFGKGAAADFYASAFTTADATDRCTNGTFAEYVTNGAFGSDTGWTKGTGWTIAAGVATATGAISTAISQTSAITLIAGYTYTITYDITRTAGTITPSIGGTAGTAQNADGTYTETIVAGSTQILAFTGAGFSGTLDNVTVTGWVLGTGWTTDGSTAIATGAIDTDLSQTVNSAYPLVEGQIYYVTFTMTRSAGSVAVSLGGGTAGTSRSSAATFSEYITAGSTQDILFDASGFSGTIDTVTVLPAAKVPADTTNGTASEQNPVGWFLNSNVDTISIVSAGTPIITASFYK